MHFFFESSYFLPTSKLYMVAGKNCFRGGHVVLKIMDGTFRFMKFARHTLCVFFGLPFTFSFKKKTSFSRRKRIFRSVRKFVAKPQERIFFIFVSKISALLIFFGSASLKRQERKDSNRVVFKDQTFLSCVLEHGIASHAPKKKKHKKG